MKNPIAKWYPAHSSNYTLGRGKTLDQITIHHMAYQPTTLRYLWGNPDRNGSSTYGVFPTKIEQYVQEIDTPWTNSNWSSNQRSITIEVWGDWRGGFNSEPTRTQLLILLKDLRKRHPNAKLTYHTTEADSSRPTVCPAELKTKGIAKAIWDMADPNKRTADLRVDIKDKKVVLKTDANVWDMRFTSWANARAITRLKAGTVIDVAGIYKHPLGGEYYLSNYSWDRGLNNGINVEDCEDHTVKPKPTPEVPIDSGAGEVPVVPENPTTGERLNRLEAIVQQIVSFLTLVFKDFKIKE